MKIIFRIICVSLIAVWSACADEHLPQTEAGRIVLNFSSGLSVSRNTEYISVESALSHLDIFIWNLDGTDGAPNTIKHYERINGPLNSPRGSVSLQVQKNDFDNDKLYRMDVIANATASEDEFNDFNQWTDLRDAVQEDYRIQVTGGKEFGAIGPTIQGVPSHFLMDGIAKQGDNNKLQLNSVYSDDIHLSVILNRAAAKVEVRLNKVGENIEFMDTTILAVKEVMGYYLRNLCFRTNLIAEGTTSHINFLRKTDLYADATNIYFHWTESQVSLVAYVYSHHWAASDFFGEGTRMVVNLPVKYDGKEYTNSFYQILLTQGEGSGDGKIYGFNRNTHYIVEATINAPGAIDHSEPVELSNLAYSAKEWKRLDINIGDDAKPEYLSVNKNEMDMHVIAKDSTSLSFISSSDVIVTIDDIWYINKFGQPVHISADDSISVKADAGLTGNITVKSPVPVNNAIRYIQFKVNNQDNSEAQTILVRQYPLEYITNIQGWYSYRSDFGGTTYQNYGTNGYVGASWNEGNNRWDYSRNEGSSDGALLGSKVAVPKNNGTGKSTLYYYYWGKEESNWVWPGGLQTSWRRYSEAKSLAGNLASLQNARMYHVRITSTSPEYKVGIPKHTINNDETVVINGESHYAHYTDESEENKTLVSPSFMIASQLGATQSPANVEIAAKHCANYVEVYKDENGNPVHLTNWRLPTEAEVKIIMKFQYVENAAMDEVLSGKYYWSATGTVLNEKKKADTSTQTAVRCIRDAY